jgi:hypothetical protein
VLKLPRAAIDAPFYIVRFVGPCTPNQIVLKKRSFEVRKQTAAELFGFFRANNSLPVYATPIDVDTLNALPAVGNAPGLRVQIIESADGGLNVMQQEALERDQLGVDMDAERQHRTILVHASAAGGAGEQLQRGVNLVVRRSSTLAASGFN